ncbi:ABC transporter permease [Evansella tamaricis]|uniref:Transport permease protein n=1 Tax=Evansella tamaricis TaxID=2069301 RepID=A0ABS6JCZ7_9BACI|nr:ABC transporter permease [Evansella tamaricis]MBU9711537.1 ABC transporter permease [Evansella tamaricis]
MNTSSTSSHTNQASSIDSVKLKQALLTRSRPKKANWFSNTMTFSWRALLKLKYIPEQLLDVTVFPIMFLLMFTYLFGGAIAGSTGDYLQFLLPGILVMTVITITMYTGMELNNDISKGIFDRFRSLPIWRPSVLVGALFVDAVRYSIASLIMIGLGLILGFRPDGGTIGVISAVGLLLLFSFSLSWIWTTLGLVLRSEKSLMGVSMMVLFPLTFISNVFVDPSTLPSWLQAFVDINPVSLLVTAVRGLMHGVATTEQIGVVIIASLLLILVFAPLTMFLYKNKN